MDDKQDSALLGWCWCLYVADHALTVASLKDPQCGKSSGYLLPDMGSIPDFFLMEWELVKLKFATKSLIYKLIYHLIF